MIRFAARIAILIGAVALGLSSAAGQGTGLVPDTSSQVGVSLQAGMGSTNLSWAFVRAFFYEGVLSQSVRKEALSHAKTVGNHIGHFSSAHVFYRQNVAKGQLYLGMQGCQFFESQFSEDLFAILFLGNKEYEGKVAQLHPFYFRETSFLRYNIGWQRPWPGGLWAVRFGLVQGMSHHRLETQKASLFTADGGRYLDLTLDFAHWQAKADNSWKGTGAAADVYFQLNIGNKSTLSFGAENIGFIQWGNPSVQRRLDTSHRFEGIAIENLFDSLFVKPKSFNEIKNEWIAEKQDDDLRQALPLVGTVHLNYRLGHHTRVFFQAQYLSLKSFTTRLGIGVWRQLGNVTALGIQANLGGFTAYDVGVSLEQKLFFGIHLTANATVSPHLISKNILGVYGGAGLYWKL